jgi:isoleucyl-tRNA synthetase
MYDFKQTEEEIIKFWDKNKIYPLLKKRNSKGKKFYFLQGPPYTSGYLHLGQAWNEGMKDMVLRYHRMNGRDVWDRGGFDMHGLPTARKVQAAEKLESKEDIEKFGVENFIQKCVQFSEEKAAQMNKDLWRMGVWLDHKNAYMPISNTYIESVWWFIKKAHEKGRLYEGLRTIHWDVATETAVAKHELEYKSVKDTAIYVKFKRKDKKNSYFLAFTTTPWTIPLNLAIMVNPEIDYVEAQVGKETWVVAKNLLESVMQKAKIDSFKVVSTFKGKKLDKEEYEHPLHILEYLPGNVKKAKRLFTVLLSKEYVDDSMGTGLVHCAPGCGPEDYEVGHQYHIPPFNCVNGKGIFENIGDFTGWVAKTDDSKFVKYMDDKEILVAKESYVHDYPHGERSHEPVIFRTTKQWFLKTEDLKEEMLKQNKQVYWRPQAAKNAFNSWLTNLRDNSITKQRYWGTPVPIWRNVEDPDDYIVIGSSKELKELGAKVPKNLHKPWIDNVEIKKDGKTYKRMPDILDVWIDAGSASWACLDYPQQKDLFNKYYPADFIIEGKDQIRGWFNLLMVGSVLGFGKKAFTNVYMHGFVTDVSGVKMSKSLGNVISPYELLDKHGVDAMRVYMTSTTAGEDISFSWDELKLKYKNLSILWNVHKYLINYCKNFEIKPKLDVKKLDLEEKYILSRLHSTIKTLTEYMEEYKIDLVPGLIEKLFLDLSRVYIQFTRDKVNEKPEVVLGTLYEVLMESTKLLSILAPFISEKIYLNLKEEFGLKEMSVHHCKWPKANEKLIDKELERNFEILDNLLQSTLAARDKAGMGVRWPLQQITVISANKDVKKALKKVEGILLSHTNIKKLKVEDSLKGAKKTVQINKNAIGKDFKRDSVIIIKELNEKKLQELVEKGKLKVKNFTLGLNHVKVTEELPKGVIGSTFSKGSVYIDLEMTPELEAEGFAREVTRRIQEMRKNEGMEKKDRITLNISSKYNIESFAKEIQQKVGADQITFNGNKNKIESVFKVKGKEFIISINKK